MLARFLLISVAAMFLGGCVQTTHEYPKIAKPDAKDKKHLEKARYAQADVPEHYRPHIVGYHRKESAGSIVIDSDARFLYFVLPEGKAIRYGIAVGEEALTFSGIARIGRKAEWPGWTPTAATKKRIGGLPDFVSPGIDNPLGARALYLHANGADTLYRIHGTNQPEYIGHAISSGCIRMTNEDVIDLYSRTNAGAIVVVLAPGQGDSPFNPHRIAAMPGG